jgi:hypothetical protein
MGRKKFSAEMKFKTVFQTASILALASSEILFLSAAG